MIKAVDSLPKLGQVPHLGVLRNRGLNIDIDVASGRLPVIWDQHVRAINMLKYNCFL